MGKRTGRPRGRPPGSLNKATIERQAFASEGLKAALEAGVSPLDVILRVMRGDPDITDRQFQAAQAAAPYVHARLSSATITHKDPLDGLTTDELRSLIAELAHARANAGTGEACAEQAGSEEAGEPAIH